MITMEIFYMFWPRLNIVMWMNLIPGENQMFNDNSHKTYAFDIRKSQEIHQQNQLKYSNITYFFNITSQKII